MSPPPARPYVLAPRRIAVACGTAVALLGGVVLLAWALDLEGLKHLRPSWPAMKANTALAFLALGSSVVLAARAKGPRPLLAARLLAGVVLAIGALTLLEYVLVADLGIDEALVRDDSPGNAYPGRPALLTSVAFLLTGWAALRWGRPTPTTVGLAIGASLLALANLTFSAMGTDPPIPGSAMAVHTTVGFVVAVAGILLGQPGTMASLLLGRGRASSLARWILTPIILLPLALVYGIRVATRKGVVDLPQAIGTAAFLDLAALVLIVLGLALRMRQDEAALATARAHEKAITDTAQDAIVTAGPDGVIRTANRAAEALFGRPASQLVGSPLTSLMPERYRDAHRQGLARYLASGEARVIGRPVELAALRGDGSEVPVELVLGASQLEGEPFFTGILRDITERRKARQALEDQARRTDMAEQATGRGSWEWDVTQDRATWSKGMYRLFGLDPATFQNSNDNFLAMVHPDDRPRMGQAIADALARPGRFLQEYRLRRPDGTQIHVRGEGNVQADPAGKATMIFGFVQDVTEIREVEAAASRARERFQRIFEASPVATVLSKVDGSIEDANLALTRMLGYTREELVAPGFTARSLYHDPQERDRVIIALRRSGAVRDRELALRRKDGSVLHVLIALEFIDLGGNTTILSLFQDITDLKQAQQDREARIASEAELERLRRTDEFRSQFINSTAHELRTPLTPLVLGVSSLRRHMQGNSDALRQLAALERSTERLRRVIADMVSAADLQARAITLDLRRLELGPQLAASVASHQEAARRANVVLEAGAGDGLAVLADEHRLQLALGHLIGNALKFTPPGGRVTVSSEPAGEHARILVADTGAGLTVTQMSELWKPYSQVHDKSQRTDSGAGLGLFVTRGIVELHGGEVGVSSPGPGKGSTFWFTLRLAPQEARGKTDAATRAAPEDRAEGDAAPDAGTDRAWPAASGP